MNFEDFLKIHRYFDFYNFIKKDKSQTLYQKIRRGIVILLHQRKKEDPRENDNKIIEFIDKITQETVEKHILKWNKQQKREKTIKQKTNEFREYFERYILRKMYTRTFRLNPKEDEEKDKALRAFFRKLSFIKPKHLEIPEDLVKQKGAHKARKKLQEINNAKNPHDKIERICESCNQINKILDRANMNGADSFFPFFIYQVLHANPLNIHSNIEYILRFKNSNLLSMTQAGYYFTNFSSAVRFLENLTAQQVLMSQEEFENHMNQIKSEENEPKYLFENVPLEKLNIRDLRDILLEYKKIALENEELKGILQKKQLKQK
ncbi:rab5 gdp/gtp exchange factor [Anaeramoeba ignava]|uniref:Rab5 gdp/gtp exchange factor n=1 Tax=Anaeramoeba ignava TaxID=1746090 RepID=A0A9Q0LI61_ANAIG|nr:rab5 gdp/gtp exchange factor [Anaeramoeba ignava]